MSILSKIKDIEDEMARTQKNKATSGHLGLLKARLSKLKAELVAEVTKGGGGGGGDGAAQPLLLPLLPLPPLPRLPARPTALIAALCRAQASR